MAMFDRLFLARHILSDVQSSVWDIRDITISIRKRVQKLETAIMANLDQLQAAVDRNGQAVAGAVTALVDQRAKIAALQAAVDAGNVDADKLAALTASIDASSDAVAQALAPVVDDPHTDTGDTAPLPEQNPDTTDPASVDGSVPAGEPLPEQ